MTVVRGQASIILLLLLLSALSGCSLLASHQVGSGEQAMRQHPDRYVVVTVVNSAQPMPADAASATHGYGGDGGYIVGAQASTLAKGIAATHHLQAVASWPIRTLGIHCLVYQMDDQADQGLVLQALSKDQRVESAQPLESFATQVGGVGGSVNVNSVTDYNDPYARLQGNLTTLSVPQAQRVSTGEGVKVAVIDTGVDSAHPDLAHRIVSERNFVDGDVEQFHRDAHGTAVAGVIAAVTNNHEGIAGIAPAARILALKACWQQESAAARCNSFTLALALSNAIESHADVVNLSLSGPFDPLLARLVQAGQSRGMLFVGAIPPQSTGAVFPTDVPGVIAVSVSGEGISSDKLSAPGREILTLTPGGHYDVASGSSMSAAEVTGVVTLIRARQPKLTSTGVRAALLQSMRGNNGIQAVNACVALIGLNDQRCLGTAH